MPCLRAVRCGGQWLWLPLEDLQTSSRRARTPVGCAASRVRVSQRNHASATVGVRLLTHDGPRVAQHFAQSMDDTHRVMAGPLPRTTSQEERAALYLQLLDELSDEEARAAPQPQGLPTCRDRAARLTGGGCRC